MRLGCLDRLPSLYQMVSGQCVGLELWGEQRALLGVGPFF